MKFKQMQWEQRNTILSISKVMGLVYCIEGMEPQVRCVVEGCTLYRGDSLDGAKEAAQVDAQRRIEELVE